MRKTHKDLEFHIDCPDGSTRVHKTSEDAAAHAIALAISGREVTIDVVTWSEGAARAYGGDDAVEVYREDPEASVHDRIVVRAESLGRVA